ncbi:MAG: flavodoxin family protein [Lachnospiraceae bacterium]
MKRMLAIFGGPHKKGATGTMLQYAVNVAKKSGWQVDEVYLYEKNIAFCNGCRTCMKTQVCVIKDDIQEIADLLKKCDIVVLAAPVYWANVPAAVKNLFDRLNGVVMEETKTFSKPRLSKKQKYYLLTACNTQAPFSAIFGQTTGAIRSMKEFFKTAGMTFGGKCTWTGLNKGALSERKKKKIEGWMIVV